MAGTWCMRQRRQGKGRGNMFRLFKKEKKQLTYDRETQKPVIRCSICTGEQVAGFKDVHTGKFTDIMLIRDEKDLREFKEMYGITEIGKEI